MSKGWREIVDENLELLLKCTAVTSEMATVLSTYKLITNTEKDKLMNPSISDYDRATLLYVGISKKWGDEGFQKFKLALNEGGNTRALEILNQIESSLKQTEVEEGKLWRVVNLLERKIAELQMSTEYGKKVTEEETRRLLKKLELETSARLSTHDANCGLRGAADREQISTIIARLRQVDGMRIATITNSNRMEKLEEQLKKMAAENAELRAEVAQLKKSCGPEGAKLRGEVNELDGSWRSNGTAFQGRWRVGVERMKIEGQDDLTTRQLAVEALEACKLTPSKSTKDSVMKVSDLKSSIEKSFVSLPTLITTVQTTLPSNEKNVWKLAVNEQHQLSKQYKLFLNRFEEMREYKELDLKKIMGRWFCIEELFPPNSTPFDVIRQEFSFALNGTTIDFSGRVGKGQTLKWYFNVDRNHQWSQINEGRREIDFIWIQTDYCNWGLLLTCDKNTSTPEFIYILSREKTLSLETLETLRDVAQKHGFPKSNGRLIP